MANHRKMDLLGVSAFCESLGMMIRAGIQVTEAVSLLDDKDQGNGVLSHAVKEMGQRIEEGSSLAGAMKETGLFPDYALQMITAGETTGKLENVLFRLASYYKEQHTINERLRSALIYPAAMLAMIIVVLLIMLRMVLPAFTGVYQSLTGSLSASSYRYINAAYLFCRIALVLMVLIVLVIAAGILLWNGSGKETVKRILSKNRLCASVLEDLSLYRFTSAFEVFLSSGKMQDLAVLDAADTADYQPVREKIDRMALRMEEGIGFAQAANENGLYEPIYGRMLIPAERSGDISSALHRLIELLLENIENSIDRLINTVEPLLSGVLMITIAAALLSVMLPLIGIMNSIG